MPDEDWSQTETAMVGRYWCSGCEPDADQIAELLVPRPCLTHDIVPKGADDDAMNPIVGLGINTEADGDACRTFAAWQRGVAA